MKNWVAFLKEMLDKNGFGNVWIDQGTQCEKVFVHDFEKRVKDIFIQNNNTEIDNLSEHRLYRYLYLDHELPWYLKNINEKNIRVAITKLRLGSHNFLVERGRWEKPKINFVDRSCSICNDIEDEYHIVCKCPRFNHLRKHYIPKSLIHKPSMYEFIRLICSKDVNVLKNLGIFFYKASLDYDKSVL